MLRGFVNARYPHCRHSFKAPDIEQNATVLSMPVTCPSCQKELQLHELDKFKSPSFIKVDYSISYI